MDSRYTPGNGEDRQAQETGPDMEGNTTWNPDGRFEKMMTGSAQARDCPLFENVLALCPHGRGGGRPGKDLR